MIRKILITALLLSPLVARAQLLSVTATLTDSDSTVWANATCTVAVVSGTFSPPTYQGTPIPTGPQTCSVNGSGVLSTSIYNTTTATPVGTLYRFTISSNTSAAPVTFTTPVTAANMTSTLSALLVAPRFPATTAFTFGYVDVEAIPGTPGSMYYEIGTGQRVWSGSAWATGGGGGGTCGSNNIPCTNTTNTWTAAQTFNGTGDTFNAGGGTVTLNAASFAVNAPITSTAVSSTSVPYLAVGGYGFFMFKDATPSFGASWAYTVPGGSAGNNPIFSIYNGSTWAAGITFNSSTTDATFGKSVIATGTPGTAGAGAISYSGTSAVSSNCGSLSGAAGCVEINVAGTLHYVPYY